MEVLGIDIGGSGIKGAPVDTETGEMLADRFRIATPQPSTPDAVGDVVAQVAEHFEWKGAIGCTFPAVVKRGMTFTAANVDKSWIGTDAAGVLAKKTGCHTFMLNDGDAAGIAEMLFGAGKGRDGLVFMLTIGTGIGSAILVNGELVPNTELGHIKIRGKDAEERASDRIRHERQLSWKKWGKSLTEFLNYLEALFSPDLFILGGGVIKKADKFFPYLETSTEIVPAALGNNAGIVGAAVAVASLMQKGVQF